MRTSIVLATSLAVIETASAFLPAPSLPLSTQRDSARIALQMSDAQPQGRRQALLTFAGVTAGALLPETKPAVAADPEITVYFGAGCFWHVQHEFIEAERRILGRKNDELTAVSGYAGGTKTGKDGKVCYHNLMMDSDYGRLGHGEAVGMKIPESKLPEFSEQFFKLFNKKGERADPQDRGGEYRSVLGVPGGMANPQFNIIQDLANKKGMKLAMGKGNDPDTLGKGMVFVYDTDKFPFYPGEVYHQFHNDMLEIYPKEYNALRKTKADEGVLKSTGCPEIGF